MPAVRLHALGLSVNAAAWRAYSQRKADETFVRFADAVLQRDQQTCRFCGFQAEKYQEVINLDGDYQRNVIDNMVSQSCVDQILMTTIAINYNKLTQCDQIYSSI